MDGKKKNDDVDNVSMKGSRKIAFVNSRRGRHLFVFNKYIIQLPQ
jgi:hypothetical protein